MRFPHLLEPHFEDSGGSGGGSELGLPSFLDTSEI